MARKSSKSLGGWNYGSSPAQGAAGTREASDGQVASGFLSGINSATDDPIKQYQVPSLSGSTIRHDVTPGVWGRCSKRP